MAQKRNLTDLIRQNASGLSSSSPITQTVAPTTAPNEELNQKIQDLEHEVIELRRQANTDQDKEFLEQQIQDLTKQLAAVGGEHIVEIDLIDPDPNQPRTIFPRALIEERTESLKRNGQISPIILIPQENGRYRLFDGAVRRLSGPKAGLATLRAVLLPHHESLDDATRFEQQFVTGKDTEKLHDLDVANGLVRIICSRHPHLEEKQIDFPKILNNVIYQIRKSGKLKELTKMVNKPIEQQKEWLDSLGLESSEGRDILEILLDRQFNPASISANVFPLLSITDDLKAVVQETGLSSGKIMAINKLTAEALNTNEADAKQVRSQLAYRIAEQELTEKETNDLIRKTIQEHNPAAKQPDPIVEKSVKTVKQIQNIKLDEFKPDQLRSIRESLQERIREIDQLLEGK